MSDVAQNHTDAIGYLDDLVAEINQPWFKLLRDIIVIHNSATLDAEMLESVCKTHLGEADEIPSIAPAVQQAPAAQVATCTDYLERLSSYTN
jgi:hypothetical protein